MGNRVSGRLVMALIVVTLTLAAAAERTGSVERPTASPRAFVPPETCPGPAPCVPGYWAFRAPDCEYYGARHAPGTVLWLESGPTLQCRCRLVWLLTKPNEPPAAKVSCAWIDLDEERFHD